MNKPWGSSCEGAAILHLDMDAFFASVEIRDDPSLAGKPVVVGGSSGRGVVAAASYEARAWGIRSAMPVARARQLCPSLVVARPRMERYSEVSRQVMHLLRDVTDGVEQLSVDEAFLDVAGARKLLGDSVTIGGGLRMRIRQELGLPASVGVGASKQIAKLASQRAKPDGLLLVEAQRSLEFLHSLPAGALWGVGEKTRQRLASYGIETVRQVALTPREQLVRLLGASAGNRIHDLANNIDPRRVEEQNPEKSVGGETTFGEDTRDLQRMSQVLLGQAHSAARRLRAAGLAARIVTVKVRWSDFTTVTRRRTLPTPTLSGAQIHRASVELLESLTGEGKKVRLLGLRLEGLAPPDSQGTLFDDLHREIGSATDSPRQPGAEGVPGATPKRMEQAERALDSAVAKFGPGIVKPASLLPPKE